MKPPFIRVTYPKLEGGFVFKAGAICFEPLTAQGWSLSMGLPALVIAIKGFFDNHDLSVVSTGKDGVIKDYTLDAALRESEHIAKVHKGGSSWSVGVEKLKS